jgi:hypothetical protein
LASLNYRDADRLFWRRAADRQALKAEGSAQLAASAWHHRDDHLDRLEHFEAELKRVRAEN